MARRIPVREILRLRESGLSQNAIAAALHVSKTSVSDTLAAASEKGVSWEDAEGMGGPGAHGALFPERVHEGPACADPDWAHVHGGLAKSGVTLRLLHAGHADGCASRGEPSMSYDRFCKRYRELAVRPGAAGRVGHKAGRITEVDWAGPTMRVVDPATGEARKAYLFVACLPFSRYSYVEPTLDMGQDTWLRCHVHAFEPFGGSTPCIVPDNLKAGVKSHPKEGGVVINAAYEELAAHYGAAVMPARVRRPRDKPSAENEVWSAATYAVAALRGEVFTDIRELRAAVAERVAQHNAAPFPKREGSRLQCFLEEERPRPGPFPPRRPRRVGGPAAAGPGPAAASPAPATSVRRAACWSAGRSTCASPSPSSRCSSAASTSPRTRCSRVTPATGTRPMPATCRRAGPTRTGTRRESGAGPTGWVRRAGRSSTGCSRPTATPGRRSTAAWRC